MFLKTLSRLSCGLKLSPSPHRISGTQSDLWVLSYLSHQGSSPQLFSLSGWSAVGRVLADQNIFHITIMETTEQ